MINVLNSFVRHDLRLKWLNTCVVLTLVILLTPLRKCVKLSVLLDSCSAEWPRHCPGWTAHPRRVIMTVSFLFKKHFLFKMLQWISICVAVAHQHISTRDESCSVNELNALTPPPPPQWSTSNWSRSQRWLSPRAAARASTPRTALCQLVSSPPTACLSVATVSTHGASPSEQRTSSFFSLFFSCYFFRPLQPPRPHSFQLKWLFRVTVWMCITVLKLIIWRKIKYILKKKVKKKNKEYVKTICSDFHQLHGIIYDCRLT